MSGIEGLEKEEGASGPAGPAEAEGLIVLEGILRAKPATAESITVAVADKIDGSRVKRLLDGFERAGMVECTLSMDESGRMKTHYSLSALGRGMLKATGRPPQPRLRVKLGAVAFIAASWAAFAGLLATNIGLMANPLFAAGSVFLALSMALPLPSLFRQLWPRRPARGE